MIDRPYRSHYEDDEDFQEALDAYEEALIEAAEERYYESKYQQ